MALADGEVWKEQSHMCWAHGAEKRNVCGPSREELAADGQVLSHPVLVAVLETGF